MYKEVNIVKNKISQYAEANVTFTKLHFDVQ